MQEYSYLSKKSNNQALILASAFFFAGLILIAATAVFSIPFVGIFQGLSVLFLTFSVLLLTRFVYKSFALRVFLNERDEFDFTVTEIYGKTQITVCRISLDNIEKVCIKTKENAKKLKKETKGRKIYSYCPDVFPEGECWVFVTECDMPLLIKLSPDQTLLNILSAAVKQKNDLAE